MLHVQGNIAGTVTIDEYADPALWTPAERAESAYYVHRLIVARVYAGQGFGASILDWCCRRAYEKGKKWIRVDVWSSNLRLQEYYWGEHFVPVRNIYSEYPSGALLQRPASGSPYVLLSDT
jgi:ribosomal protein S18 acetylase RimI-like enzyme